MKVFEIAGPVFTGPSADFAPKIAEPAEELTSGADIVLSKNGEQAVRDLKLSDQEVELLKAVALGWADPSDLGDLEQDIFDYWLEANPEDFNPNLHGGGADPSDTIMDELESWFEDAVKEWSKGDTAAADKDSRKVQRTGTHANRKWAVPENNEGESVMKDEDISRMRKLAGIKSEAAGKANQVNRNSGSWWSGDIDGSEFAINKAASRVDDFSAGGTFDPKPSFGDVEGISKPTPNVDTFSSKSHKKVRKNTDPDR